MPAKRVEMQPPSRRIAVKSTIADHAKIAKAKKMSKPSSASDHPNLKCRESHCESCKQGSHSFEQDLIPRGIEAYLYWHKRELVKQTGIMTTMGKECGHCNYVRLKFWPKGTSQDKLNDLRKTDSSVDQRFFELREDRATGENKFFADGVNVVHKSKKVDQSFDEGYDEGEFFELWAFNRAQQLGFTRDQKDELIRHCKALGHDVDVGENGELGVFKSKLSVGASYAYRRGFKHASQHQAEQEHEHAEDAAHAALEEAPGGAAVPVHSSASSVAENAVSSPNSSSMWPFNLPNLPMAPMALDSSSNVSGFSGTCSSSRSTAASSMDYGRDGDGDGIDDCDRDPEKGDPGRQVLPDDSGSVTAPRHKRMRSGDPAAAAAVLAAAAVAATAPQAKRKNKGDSMVDDAKQFLDTTLETYTAEHFWNRRVRARDYESVLARLSSKATKLSTFFDHPSAGRLSEQLFKTATTLESMKNCSMIFGKALKKSFVAVRGIAGRAHCPKKIRIFYAWCQRLSCPTCFLQWFTTSCRRTTCR